MFENFLTERNDVVDNAVYQLILELTGKTEDELPWDMSIIGDVTDSIEDALAQHGIILCHPYYEENESESVPCYKGSDCCSTECPLKQKSDTPQQQEGSTLKMVCPECGNDKWEHVPENGYRCTTCDKFHSPDDMFIQKENKSET